MGAVLALDQTLIIYLNQIALSSGFLLQISRIFAIGAIFAVVGFFALTFFMEFSFMRMPPRTLLNAGVIAALSVWLFNQLIGFFYMRERPYRALESVQTLIGDPLTTKSFPSDHTALAFVFATLMTLWEPRVGGWLLVLAILIGISRIMTGVHYPLDVLGGACIGIVIALIIHKFML